MHQKQFFGTSVEPARTRLTAGSVGGRTALATLCMLPLTGLLFRASTWRKTQMIDVNRKAKLTTLVGLFGLLLLGVTACTDATSSTQPTRSADTPDVIQDQQKLSQSCTTIRRTVVINRRSQLQRLGRLDCFRIEGHLFIQNTDFQSISQLEGLKSVSRWIGISDNAKLEKIMLPKLQHVGKGMVVEGNSSLEKVKANKLGFVGYNLHLFNNADLEEVYFNCLTQVVNDVIFAGNNKLEKLKMPYLTKIGGTFIYEHSDKLEELCLPRLSKVAEDFTVHFNGKLEIVSAPLLSYIGGTATIERNPKLEGLWLKSLAEVKGDVKVTDNHELPQCKVQTYVDRILQVGGSTHISNNSDQCNHMAQPPAQCGDPCMQRPLRPARDRCPPKNNNGHNPEDENGGT
jgi:hypothetical protein